MIKKSPLQVRSMEVGVRSILGMWLGVNNFVLGFRSRPNFGRLKPPLPQTNVLYLTIVQVDAMRYALCTLRLLTDNIHQFPGDQDHPPDLFPFEQFLNPFAFRSEERRV